MKVLQISLLLALALALSARRVRACSDIHYEDRNQIAIPPTALPSIHGIALDPKEAPMSNICVGLFTDDPAHRIITAVRTDKSGTFSFSGIRPGTYRVVVNAAGLCPANILIRIVHRRKGHSLLIHMRPQSLDSCSSFDLK